MLKIDIIAVGRLRKGPFFELCQDYSTRIRWSLSLYEVESKQTDAAAAQREESRKIAEHLHESATLIALDERGESLRSTEFASVLRTFADSGRSHIQFVIGGADGLTPDIRDRAHRLMSFGRQTWPHLLARVMLLEQVYRAQQIIAGHPYHRE
ncbi:MAG: 23S rRNA (pseudouridine(1915)-N(3))-methyltransferase RlmH [Alphaproteobacteria bacterium]|nr:23S rRNA (pseudouridine(1915)-N(3))-methyltransferase RlmH [Alphaproteobacteria bacterium]